MSPREPDIGRVAKAVVAEARPGVVVAVFSRAVYLRFDCLSGANVVALTTLDVPSGPLHIRVPVLPRLRVGDWVMPRDRALQTALGPTVEIPASVWVPGPIDDLARRRVAGAALLREVLAYRSPPDLAGDSCDVHAVVTALGLRSGLARLAGRGAGLTPAGDDCAAGILLVTALLDATGMTTWTPQELAALAAGHDSHDIAVAFLKAAADGESIEPLHLLLAAIARGDRSAALLQRRMLAGIGHTSGLDLAYGALVGLELADTIAAERTADVARDRAISVSHNAT